MELIVCVTAGGPKTHHPAPCSVSRSVAAIEGASLRRAPQHDPPVRRRSDTIMGRALQGQAVRPTAAAVLTRRSARLVAIAFHATRTRVLMPRGRSRAAGSACLRRSRLDGPALPLGLEAAAPLTAISVRHALSLSGKGVRSGAVRLASIHRLARWGEGRVAGSPGWGQLKPSLRRGAGVGAARRGWPRRSGACAWRSWAGEIGADGADAPRSSEGASGGGGERSDAGERFDEVGLPRPAGWQVQRPATPTVGQASG
jgi:hypothetical protein